MVTQLFLSDARPALMPGIPPVLAPVAHIFLAVPAVLGTIQSIFTMVPPVFNAIPTPAVVTRIDTIFAPVAAIFTAIPAVLCTIATVFAAITNVLQPVAYLRMPACRRLCGRRGCAYHDPEQRHSKTIEHMSFPGLWLPCSRDAANG